MERDIKFRFFFKSDGTMLDWLTVRQTAFNRGDLHLCYDVFGTNPDIIKMQYAGYKDKFEKEVFDGDICKTDYNSKHWEVKWGDFGWEFNNHRIKNPKYRLAGDEKYSFERYLKILKGGSAGLTVVGNIYETPELLLP